MKSILLILCLIVLAHSGPNKQKCSGDAACEACALSWFCEYGNSDDLKEDCYSNCLKNKIAYDQHKDVNNAQETTVHGTSFLQTKAKFSETPEKDKCMRNPACEGCSLSWQCEYGQNAELVEECYKHCWVNKVGYDIHQSVRDAEEVTVHK